MSKVFAFRFSAKDVSGLGWILFSLIFFFIILFTYVVCAGSLLPHGLFSSWGEVGLR